MIKWKKLDRSMVQTSPLTETPNIISIVNLLWSIVLVGTLLGVLPSQSVDTVAAALVTSPPCQLMHWIYSC